MQNVLAYSPKSEGEKFQQIKQSRNWNRFHKMRESF